MAKRKKTGGRDFKPGQSGNPKGAKPIPGDIKAARFLNSIELERILNELMYQIEASELDSVLHDSTRKPIEQMVARIILEAIEKGDSLRLDFLLNRLIGKVTEKVKLEIPKPYIIERRDGTQVELGAKLDDDNSGGE